MISVQICNWLLTRRCNLRCNYCRLVIDYKNKPEQYPDMSYYYNNEQDSEGVIETLKRLKKHNPNMFHIFYGGEPTLYDGLESIVSFCNENNIEYTIITNSTDVAKRRIKTIYNRCGLIKGLTASVDPVLVSNLTEDSDIKKKTDNGFSLLQQYKDKVKDLVAEITCTNDNVHNLVPTVAKLSETRIWSSITVVEVAVTKYYDFSNCTDRSLLVKKSKIRDQLNVLVNGSYLIHMKDKLLNCLYKYLPQLYYCKIGDIPFHNLTIDSDGRPRLCLRIRGTELPSNKMLDYIDKNGTFSNDFLGKAKADYYNLCKSCIWTCPMMSELTLKGLSPVSKLLHNRS